jgi:hypothetical protein
VERISQCGDVTEDLDFRDRRRGQGRRGRRFARPWAITFRVVGHLAIVGQTAVAMQQMFAVVRVLGPYGPG